MMLNLLQLGIMQSNLKQFHFDVVNTAAAAVDVVTSYYVAAVIGDAAVCDPVGNAVDDSTGDDRTL